MRRILGFIQHGERHLESVHVWELISRHALTLSTMLICWNPANFVQPPDDRFTTRHRGLPSTTGHTFWLFDITASLRIMLQKERSVKTEECAILLILLGHNGGDFCHW